MKPVLSLLRLFVWGVIALTNSVNAKADTDFNLRVNLKTHALDIENLPHTLFTEQPLSFIKYRIQKRSFATTGHAFDLGWVTWESGFADGGGRIVFRRDLSAQDRSIRVQIRFESPILSIKQFGNLSHPWITIAQRNVSLTEHDESYELNFGNRIFYRSDLVTSPARGGIDLESRPFLFNDEQHLRSLLFYYGQKYTSYYSGFSNNGLPRINLIYPMPSIDPEATALAAPTDIEALAIRFFTTGPIDLLYLSYLSDTDIYLPQNFIHDLSINHYAKLNDAIQDDTLDFYYGIQIHALPEAMQEITREEFNLFVIHRHLATLMAHEVNHMWYGHVVSGRLPIVEDTHLPNNPKELVFFEGLGMLMANYWYVPFNNEGYFEHLKSPKKRSYLYHYDDARNVSLEDYNRLSYGSYYILSRLVEGENVFWHDYYSDYSIEANFLLDERTDPVTGNPVNGFATDYTSLPFTLPFATDSENHPLNLGHECPRHFGLSVEEIITTVARWGQNQNWVIRNDLGTLEFLEMLVDQGLIDDQTKRIALHYADPSIENSLRFFCEMAIEPVEIEIPFETETSEYDTAIDSPKIDTKRRGYLEFRREQINEEIRELQQQIYDLSLNLVEYWSQIHQIQNPEIKRTIKTTIKQYEECPYLDPEVIRWAHFLDFPPRATNIVLLINQITESLSFLTTHYASLIAKNRSDQRNCNLNFIHNKFTELMEEHESERSYFQERYDDTRLLVDEKREQLFELQEELNEIERNLDEMR